MSQAINVTHRLRGVVPRPCWAEGLLGACGRCYEPRMTPGILCALCSQYPPGTPSCHTENIPIR